MSDFLPQIDLQNFFHFPIDTKVRGSTATPSKKSTEIKPLGTGRSDLLMMDLIGGAMHKIELLSMSGAKHISALFEFSPKDESVRRRLANFAVKVFAVNSPKISPQLHFCPAEQLR